MFTGTVTYGVLRTYAAGPPAGSVTPIAIAMHVQRVLLSVFFLGPLELLTCNIGNWTLNMMSVSDVYHLELIQEHQEHGVNLMP